MILGKNSLNLNFEHCVNNNNNNNNNKDFINSNI